MKKFFVLLACAVVAMWIVARLWVPENHNKGKTVIYWSTDPNPARKDQISPFERLHPDIAVLVEPNTFERTIVQCSTGIGPDLIEVYSVADMISYAEAGILYDLTDDAKSLGVDPDSTYAKLKGTLVYEGRQYRYPANAASQVLFYNKKTFREAGLAEPTDNMPWDEFIALVKPLTIKREKGKGYEQFALVIGRDFVQDIHLQFGAHVFNADKTRCVLDSPESIAAIAFYTKMMREQEIIPTPEAALALSGEGGWAAGELRWFATGRSATLWASRWMLVQLRQYPELRDEIGCVLLPCPPGAKSTSYCGARGPAVNKNSKHLKEALSFLQYLGGDEYSEVIAQSADALPPNRHYAEDPTRLLNPAYPNEPYHAKFVRSMEMSEAQEVSPFVDRKIVDRVWREALESAENATKTPEQAMKDAAKAINDRIARTVRERPELRKRYEALVGASGVSAFGAGQRDPLDEVALQAEE